MCARQPRVGRGDVPPPFSVQSQSQSQSQSQFSSESLALLSATSLAVPSATFFGWHLEEPVLVSDTWWLFQTLPGSSECHPNWALVRSE